MSSFLLGVGATPPKGPSIITQTRAGAGITNEQGTEISPGENFALQSLLKRHSFAKRRGAAPPTYNCHGMTFASRRTGVHDAAEIRKILVHDRYVEVTDVMPGDVVLYIGSDGDIEHSGIVVQVSPESPIYHMVCSKWGKGPEMLHTLKDCPYPDTSHKYFRVSP